MVVLPCSTYIYLFAFGYTGNGSTIGHNSDATIITHHPDIVFDALDAMQAGRCRDIATDIERLCCGLQHCISQRPVST